MPVVYHLQGQITRRFTAWANGKMVKFRTGEFHSGIVFVIGTNQFLLPKSKSKPKSSAIQSSQNRPPETSINFCLEESFRKKTRLSFHKFCCFQKFSTGTIRKAVFHFSAEFSGNFL